MKLWIAPVMLGLVTSPAIACPTADDLGRGIEFRTAGGDVELNRQLRPDWVTVSVKFPDGDGSVLETYLGLYLLSVIPIEAGVPKMGAREDYATASELNQWQAPEPDAAWVNDTPGGGRAVSGPLETTMIAGCRFDSFEIDIIYNDDATYKETFDYLPDLGVGLLTKTEATDGTDTYTYIAVNAVD